MSGGHYHAEGFIVKRLRHDAGIGERQRQDRDLELAVFQLLRQLCGKILLQQQRHFRRALVQQRDELRQQVGPDGKNRADPQRRRELVLAQSRDLPDDGGFLDYVLGLRHDPLANRRHRHFGAGTLEQRYAELRFQFLDRHRQRRLAHKAFFGRAPEMAFARDGHDVA